MIDHPPKTARRFRGVVAAAGLAVVLAPAPVTSALANDELALATLAFVHSIDATPDWSAQMRGLAIDEDSATVIIGSLVVAAERGDLVVNIEDATFAGFVAAGDGGFTARSLEIARATVSTGGTKAVLSNLRFDDIGGPALAGVAYDRSKPFTSLIGAYSALAKGRSASGRIAEIAIHETDQGETSLITYRNVAFGPLADGRLEAASAGPLTLQTPASDPLAELSIERAETAGIDLEAFVHVFDPLRYIAGSGDGTWRPAIDRARYTGLKLTVPSIELTIDTVAMDGLELRQPTESFVPLIDAVTGPRWPTPKTLNRLRSTYLGKLLSSFGVARFVVDGVVVSAAGIDQLTLGGFELKDASSDGLGEIAIQDFVAAITGQGAAQARRFALGDVVLPPFEAFDEALERAESGGDIDVSSLVPKVGAVEAAEVHLAAIDFPGLDIGRLRTDLGNHVGAVPTAIAVDLEGLDVATASLPNARLRTLIAGLGYDRISVNATVSLNWHEADSAVSLDEFELDIADFGNTTADLVLAGLTRDALEQGDNAAMLDDLRFERAQIRFEDRSVVNRSLAMRADLLDIPLDRLKQQLSGALPLMLAVLGDQAKTIVPVLQDFIKTPGTLIIEAAPEEPVPVADIASAVRTRPQSLPGLLSISVSGTPGDSEAPDQDDAPGAQDAPSNGEADGE